MTISGEIILDDTIPAPRALEQQHVEGCTLINNRKALLEHLPKNAICAEIGIEKGNFTKDIWSITKPKKLHLVEITPEFIDLAQTTYKQQCLEGTIETHLGDSAETLGSFPDHYFDWIYIDADHAYTPVKKELEHARRIVKPNGLIGLHDYTLYDPHAKTPYGVVHAVNEFCHTHNYKLTHYALSPYGFNSVVLKKI